MNLCTIIVIGAGAGGMTAAARAAECGAPVTLLEKTDSPGKKIRISGKYRCNVTNAAETDDFIRMYGPNGRFLYNALNRFGPGDVRDLLMRYGVETKVERGGRVFPVSDDAGDVVEAFRRYLEENRVTVRTGMPVREILVNQGRVTGVVTDGGTLPCEAVILAAGGASFPDTGSTGDGYRIARNCGHTIVPLRPALVPLIVKETGLARRMENAILRNVRLTAWQGTAEGIDTRSAPAHDYGRGIAGKKPPKRVIESRMGEMLITHFGIGGPITLQMSLAVVDALKSGPVSVSIDLKPALSPETLQARFQKDFDRYSKRSLRTILKEALPLKLIDTYIEAAGIPPETQGCRITGQERNRLVQVVKGFRFTIEGPLPMPSAMVTAGGVALNEIDPRTMASRIVDGLFFCGEVIDIDAETGGYNLQAAFSTGYTAGESAAAFSKNR
jgi:predicted flavoprotein YhiN